MTEQPGLPDQFKELVTENEKRMKAIQDQIANQLEAQRKAVTDLVESQQKAFAEFLEQQRSVKIGDHWEAQRKAISEQIEHQRKAFTDLVERQWAAQKKAIEDAQHAIAGRFRPKPDEPKPAEGSGSPATKHLRPLTFQRRARCAAIRHAAELYCASSRTAANTPPHHAHITDRHRPTTTSATSTIHYLALHSLSCTAGLQPLSEEHDDQGG
jgi:hypothetical protein